MCQSFKNIYTLKMETDPTENYDQVESTIKPDEPPPEDEKSEAEPVELPKPKKKGRPAGTKDAYKRTRKSTKPNASLPVPKEEQYTPPTQQLGVDMNTLADLMLERMTLRASDARAQKTKHWAKFMPNR
jgi:hypothetical protein